MLVDIWPHQHSLDRSFASSSEAPTSSLDSTIWTSSGEPSFRAPFKQIVSDGIHPLFLVHAQPTLSSAFIVGHKHMMSSLLHKSHVYEFCFSLCLFGLGSVIHFLLFCCSQILNSFFLFLILQVSYA